MGAAGVAIPPQLSEFAADGYLHSNTSGQAAINQPNMIAWQFCRGREGGFSLAPMLGRGLIGRTFCIELQVLQNNCRKSPFQVQTRHCDQQSARKEGTAGTGKHTALISRPLHNNRPVASDPSEQVPRPRRVPASVCKGEFGVLVSPPALWGSLCPTAGTGMPCCAVGREGRLILRCGCTFPAGQGCGFVSMKHIMKLRREEGS